MHMADYKTEALAYLRHVMAETDKTPTELARLANVNQTTFTRPLNSKEHKYAVKFQALARLSEETGIPLPISLVKSRPQPGGVRELRLPIRFEVGAGGFHQRDELRQEPFGHVTVPSMPPFTDAHQWLERVVSDSMDKEIPVGALIHVVDALEIHYRPTHGDIVVVERTRAQGALVERSVKRLRLTPDGAQLWPESHNPRWLGPMRLGDGSDDETASPEVRVRVEIVGLVLRAISTFVNVPDEPEPL